MQLLTHLKPKIFSLENEDLTQLISSIVLLKEVCDPKTLKAIENLTLRRLHSLNNDQFVRILKSYSLIDPSRVPKSIAFVKTFIQLCETKIDEFHVDELSILVSALIRLNNQGLQLDNFSSSVNTMVEAIQFQLTEMESTNLKGNVAAELYSTLQTKKIK